MVNFIGQQLGNYRLTRLLGSGAFGEVYLGEHVHIGTLAAIKVLIGNYTPKVEKDFKKEARTIATFNHSHIIRLLDFGEGDLGGANKVLFMVMDYAPNGTLREKHHKDQQLPLPLVISYVNQIADALQYAHDHQRIHRDVKPENMLVGQRNEILVSDFGIAVIVHSTRTQLPQDVIGTVSYMAPEQIQKYPRPASDQYSLAIMVYEWLSGFLPFEGTAHEVAIKQLSVPPPPLSAKLPSVSHDVEQVIMKALSKDPHQRFASVQEFAQALEQASQPGQATTVIPSPLPVLSNYPPAQPTIVAFPQKTLLNTYHLGAGLNAKDIMWSCDGKYLAALTNQIQVWDSRGNVIFTYPDTSPTKKNPTLFRRWLAPSVKPALPPFINKIAWSPKEPLLAIANGNVAGTGRVDIWNANTKSFVANFTVNLRWYSLSWSPDAKRIILWGIYPDAARQRDLPDKVYQDVYIWDLDLARYINRTNLSIKDPMVPVFSQGELMPAFSWSPDAQRIALISSTNPGLPPTNTTYQNVDIRNAVTGGKNFTFRLLHPIEALAWSPDGKNLAVASSGEGVVHLYNTLTGEEESFSYKGHLDHSKHRISGTNEPRVFITAIAWSLDGQYIASADGYPRHGASQTVGKVFPESHVHIWEAKTGKTIQRRIGPSECVFQLAWLSSLQSLVIRGGDVRIWHLLSDKQISTGGRLVKISPDEKRIATASRDKTLQLWDSTSGNNIFTYLDHPDGVEDIAWAPDSQRIATAPEDNTVRIWQAM